MEITGKVFVTLHGAASAIIFEGVTQDEYALAERKWAGHAMLSLAGNLLCGADIKTMHFVPNP